MKTLLVASITLLFLLIFVGCDPAPVPAPVEADAGVEVVDAAVDATPVAADGGKTDAD